MKGNAKILILHFDYQCNESIVQNLSYAGHNVFSGSSIAEARKIIAQKTPELYIILISDTNAKGSFLFLSENEHTKQIPVVISTSVSDRGIIRRLSEFSTCRSICRLEDDEMLIFNANSVLENIETLRNDSGCAFIDSESFYELTHNIEDAIWITELSDYEKVIFVNHSFEKIFNKQRYELLANPRIWMEVIAEGDIATVTDKYEEFKTIPGKKFQSTFRIFDEENNIRWIHARCWKTEFLSENPSRITMLMQDITSTVSSQEDLRIKNHAIESAVSGIILSNAYGKIFFANNTFLEMWKYTSESDVKGTSLIDLLGKTGNMDSIIETILKSGGWIGEIDAVCSDGSSFPVQASLSMVTDDNMDPIAIMSSFINITEMKKAQLEIHQNLEEKKYLLSELKHRVKNSLNIVSSLIGFEISKGMIDVNDLMKIRSRIYSISSLYSSLDTENNIGEIDLKNYIQDVIFGLEKSYIPENKNIRIDLNSDTIYTDSRISMSIGLIINEIITNSLKHSFNIKQEGTIKITIKRTEKSLEIDISNDGDEFPKNYSISESKGLGMKIVTMLTEQHKGIFKFIKGEKPHFTITIPGS